MLKLTVLLYAISVVESDIDDHAVGKAGERSRYQITATVWHEHTSAAFWLAGNPALARDVAKEHIQHCIVPALRRAALPITVENVAGCWNAGCRGYIHTKPTPERVKQYIRKVRKAYDRQIKSSVATK